MFIGGWVGLRIIFLVGSKWHEHLVIMMGTKPLWVERRPDSVRPMTWSVSLGTKGEEIWELKAPRKTRWNLKDFLCLPQNLGRWFPNFNKCMYIYASASGFFNYLLQKNLSLSERLVLMSFKNQAVLTSISSFFTSFKTTLKVSLM